jgi:hypothetical protein
MFFDYKGLVEQARAAAASERRFWIYFGPPKDDKTFFTTSVVPAIFTQEVTKADPKARPIFLYVDLQDCTLLTKAEFEQDVCEKLLASAAKNGVFVQPHNSSSIYDVMHTIALLGRPTMVTWDEVQIAAKVFGLLQILLSLGFFLSWWRNPGRFLAFKKPFTLICEMLLRCVSCLVQTKSNLCRFRFPSAVPCSVLSQTWPACAQMGML